MQRKEAAVDAVLKTARQYLKEVRGQQKYAAVGDSRRIAAVGAAEGVLRRE